MRDPRSGESAAYLGVSTISAWGRNRRWVSLRLALRRQGWPRSAGRAVVRLGDLARLLEYSSARVAAPLRVLVINVVAGLAVARVARLAPREHILSAAQGAFLGDNGLKVRRRGGLELLSRAVRRGDLALRGGVLRSARELDDLVVRIATVAGHRGRRRARRGGRTPKTRTVRRTSRWLLLLLLLHVRSHETKLRYVY